MPMNEHTKENSAKKQERSCYGHRQHILIICSAVVIVAFASLTIYGFITLNNRVNKLQTEETNRLKERCPAIEEGATGERTKRSAKPRANNQDILKRVRKMEERWNQSYRSVGRQPAFVLRGPPGKPGRDGIQGRDGTPGTGFNGQNGRDGAQGPKGVQGNRGKPGTQGISGPKGIPGPKGISGPKGIPGPKGISGPKGIPGPKGISGRKGITGPKGNQGSRGVTGVSYIRWGKKNCPNNGAKLVYEGYAGGSGHAHRGGGANYVCLTRNPVYEKYRDGFQSSTARIFGAEYESHSYGIFPNSLQDHDVPCALCYVETRVTQMMIPGTNVCPAGWTREYKGYLMAAHYVHHRTMYTCVDENPDYVRGTGADRDGALFYFVEGQCGSLPCKPYVNGRELTCAVCTR